MKKILIALLITIMAVSLLAGCSGSTGATKTGLGQIISIANSKDVSVKDGAPVDGLAQVDVTMAAVTIDANNKIVSVTIDVAQTKVKFSDVGKVTTDLTADLKTKKELGNDYGMKKASTIGKEWFEQIKVLEDWMVGKTIAEVKAMKAVSKDAQHTMVPDEADLKTSVTLSVDVFVAAVDEAVKNAK
ncbi:MAG: hypothetical protein ACYCYI_00945 [Saccharofermentanales bacterium]